MKRFFCLMMVFVSAVGLFAQDIIITKSEQSISANITEVSQTEIKYREASNPEGPILTISTSDVTTVLYANGNTQVFDKQPQRVTVVDSYGKGGNVSTRPDKFVHGYHIQYAGRNSTYNGSLSDITSGVSVGAEFAHSVAKHFFLGYGFDLDFSFSGKSYSGSLLVPLHVGFQTCKRVSHKGRQYFRFMTGPLFDCSVFSGYDGDTQWADKDSWFHCMWNCKAEYQKNKFAIHAGTAWGIHKRSGYISNMPIYAGIAYKIY